MTDISAIPGITAARVADPARPRLFPFDDLLRSDRASLAAHVRGLTVNPAADMRDAIESLPEALCEGCGEEEDEPFNCC